MIYFMRAETDGSIKIGCTDNLERRLGQHVRDYEGELTILGIMEGRPADERALHKRFSHLKTEADPICEWFRPDPELLRYISENSRPWQKTDDLPSKAKPNSLVIRGSSAWREWLKELAEFSRSTSVAELLDRAAMEYARTKGFPKAAPKR